MLLTEIIYKRMFIYEYYAKLQRIHVTRGTNL